MNIYAAQKWNGLHADYHQCACMGVVETVMALRAIPGIIEKNNGYCNVTSQ